MPYRISRWRIVARVDALMMLCDELEAKLKRSQITVGNDLTVA
jgi:hypothetical protein